MRISEEEKHSNSDNRKEWNMEVAKERMLSIKEWDWKLSPKQRQTHH